MIHQNTSINEKALLYHLGCPLRSDGSTPGPEFPVLQCAESTLHWLIDEIAAKRQPTASHTREFFDVQWQQTSYFQSRDAIPLKQYNRRLLEGVRACARLRDLLWSHEILQRVLPYQLSLNGVVISGEYTVLRSSRRKNHVFVPYLRYGGVKLRPLVPDIVSFARWVDASNRAVAQEWRVDRVGVMHYWVTQNLAAEHKPDPEFAAQVLHGAVATISRPTYPIVGEHCLACPARHCNAGVHQERHP